MNISEALTGKSPVVVAYGGGTNSTALLVGLKNVHIVPDLILFADTGGEKPHTYEHLKVVNEWCQSVGFPEIITVQKRGRIYVGETLEENCLRKNMLPSIAYGYKSCSQKYKRWPQDMYMNHWDPAKKAWAEGLKVTKLIGYDADESRRAKIMDDPKYQYVYPLIEWDWGREDCIEAIEGEGLPLPGKSACFFCPSSKKFEILELRDRYPELLERALKMEAQADLTSMKGLGRSFSWGEFLEKVEKDSSAEAVRGLPESYIPVDCGCYDGE